MNETTVTPIPDNIPYPTPLKRAKSTPPFPVGCLPPVLREMVELISETVQIMPEMPASVALSVLSLCLQGKAKISYSPFWSEELNLYILISASPGERKSPVFRALTAPIHKFTADHNDMYRQEILSCINEKKMLQTRLEREIEKNSGMGTVNAIQKELDSLEDKHFLRLITSDTTAEALAALMSENDGRMGILSDEGGQFNIMAGMYNKGSMTNLNIFLSGYDGDPVQIDRKCGSHTIMHPLLTFGICTQPIVLNSVISNTEFTGKGLAQRFLYCQPETLIGHRTLIEDLPEGGNQIQENYRKLIYRLLSMKTPACPIPTIELYCKAADLFKEYSNKIEFQMGDRQQLADHRDYFSKLPGKTLRIAGLLHLCEKRPEDCVTAETMENAIEISRYYGLQYLSVMCADNYDGTPQYLIEKILDRVRKNNLSRISLRDIKRSARKLTDDQINYALDILTDCGYLSEIPVVHDGRAGNRRKESYEVNPHLLLPGAENIPISTI